MAQAWLPLSVGAYLLFYVAFVWRSERRPVKLVHLLLVALPALASGLYIFGAGYDGATNVEVVEALRDGRSIWTLQHYFPYPPGFAVLAYAFAPFSSHTGPIIIKVKLMNFLAAVAMGAACGKTCFSGRSDGVYKGILIAGLHPLMVAICLWHGQLDPIVACLLFLSLATLNGELFQSRGSDYAAGALWGGAAMVKQWPLMFLPIVLVGLGRNQGRWMPSRTLKFMAGLLGAVLLIFSVYAVLPGTKFEGMGRALSYHGTPSASLALGLFHLQAPLWFNPWTILMSVVLGSLLALSGVFIPDACLIACMALLLFSPCMEIQYSLWPLPFSLWMYQRSPRVFWGLSGSLAAYACLMEWGYVLDWDSRWPWLSGTSRLLNEKFGPALIAAVLLSAMVWFASAWKNRTGS